MSGLQRAAASVEVKFFSWDSWLVSTQGRVVYRKAGSTTQGRTDGYFCQ